jgi:hypothetical protein
MTGLQSFSWGCFGALTPEVLRFFKLISNGESLPNINWPLYVFFLLFYVLMAGVVSVAFKPDSEWKGLWVGASLPALIATLVQAAPGIK